jgi:transmembrane sensor
MMKKDTLIRYLTNRCSADELEEIIHWIKRDSAGEESRKWGFEIWKESEPLGTIDEDERMDLLFDKIQQRIELTERTEKLDQWKQSGTALFVSWITKVAAVLLIPVLSLLVYTTVERKGASREFAQMVIDTLEIQAPAGSRTMIQLSDGSIVHLNCGSKLSYPRVFGGSSREVILMGEGYFDVAHDPDKPFVVKSGIVDVVATGTVFNIMAYPEDDCIEATLVEGSVQLERNDLKAANRIMASMLPGEHISYNANRGTMIRSKGKIEKYISWKDGKLIFEDTPIIKVAERLSRIYNVEITVNENIGDYIYTATFIDEPLFQILDLMTIVTPVKYTFNKRSKMPDGTFSKLKITLEKRD